MLSTGRKARFSTSAMISLFPSVVTSFHVCSESRLRQASVAVKFVTNTTKECKRDLLERLQRLHFNVQVEHKRFPADQMQELKLTGCCRREPAGGAVSPVVVLFPLLFSWYLTCLDRRRRSSRL